MGRPLLPCEKVGAPATHILIVGSGFAGLAFARVLQWKDGHKLPRTLVTHIEISDEGAVAAGDIKLANAREVFEACELRSSHAQGQCVTYSREFAGIDEGPVHHGWELRRRSGGERMKYMRTTARPAKPHRTSTTSSRRQPMLDRARARRSPTVAARVALIGDARRVSSASPILDGRASSTARGRRCSTAPRSLASSSAQIRPFL